jgi:hypothetical protein
MANVQPNNISTGTTQDFHSDGSVKLNSGDSIQALVPQIGFSDDGRVRISGDQILFWDTIEGAALNTNLWTTSTSTMTITQGNGYITLNANATTTAGTYAILQTNKQFLRFVGNTVFWQCVASFLPATQTVPSPGAVYEIGLANFSGATLNASDGIFLRITAGGDAYMIQSFNGQEEANPVTDNNGNPPLLIPTHFYLVECLVTDEHIHLEVVDLGTSKELPGELSLVSQDFTFLSTKPAAFSVAHLPLAARVYNLVTTVTAPTLLLGGLEVTLLDSINTRSYGEMLVVNGKGAYQGPNITAGLIQTANHANSTSPASATLSNTAAGYTTLGGRYQFAALAGAATDYALFGFQVPAGIDLVIYGVRITAMNTVATVATTATV